MISREVSLKTILGALDYFMLKKKIIEREKISFSKILKKHVRIKIGR